MSLGTSVTCLACIVHKLESLNNLTRYTSVASWRAKSIPAQNLNQLFSFWRTSLTSLQNANFRISSSIDFCNLCISCRALVPGQNHHVFLCFVTTHGAFPIVAGWEKAGGWGEDLSSPFAAFCLTEYFV